MYYLRPVYQSLASKLYVYHRDQEKFERHHQTALEEIMEQAPSGSGFDNGTKLDLTDSTEEKLVFRTSFHHMNETGYYTGWTEHKIKVTPSLLYGIDIKITGKNKNMIKDYIHDAFHSFLTSQTEK